MRGGYVGQRSRKRSFYQFFFILLISLITIIYFLINNIAPDEEEIPVNENNNIENIIENNAYVDLQKKFLESEQRLKVRDNIIQSLKDKNKLLEKNINILNQDLGTSIEKNNSLNENFLKVEKLQNSNNKLKNINKKLKNEINEINKKYNEINNNYNKILKQKLLTEEKIVILNDQSLDLNKKIEELNSTILEKNKLIDNLKDKIHH